MHPFTLLGHPVRLRIVEVLASGAHGAGELGDVIAGEFGLTRTAVSRHLRTLREAGFVSVEPEENRRQYRLHWDALASVERALADLYELWDRRYGWPYTTDPLATPPSRRREAPIRSEVEPLAVRSTDFWS